MIKFDVEGGRLEVWRAAAASMPPARVASLLPDLWELARDGFPALAASAADKDLVTHYLAPTFGAYQFVGGRLLALTSAETFEVDSGRTLYFSGSNVHSSLRGRGLYEQMLVLRIAIGRITGCRWWATRTQSPIVAHAFARLGCYPWRTDGAASQAAIEVANVLYERFSVFGRRDDEVFDPSAGVLRSAYPLSPYTTIPRIANDRIEAHFAAHVDREAGDALLLLGRLNDLLERLASRCAAHFGMPFDRLCKVLEDVCP